MKQLLEKLGFEHLPMMTVFIKEYKQALGLDLLLTDARSDAFQDIGIYLDFITQPLVKGMFVECDEDGNVLKEPKNYISWKHKRLNTPYDADLSKYEQFQQAQDGVIFEGGVGCYRYENGDINNRVEMVSIFGFRLEFDGLILRKYKTPEDLIIAGVKITLK